MFKVFFLHGFVMDSAGDEKSRHLAFWRNEFEKNSYLTNDPFSINHIFLQELVDTIFDPPFEGRAPTYGAIICSHDFDNYEEHLPRGRWITGIPTDARIYCDGIQTFRVICPRQTGVYSFTDQMIADELDLFTLRDDVLYNKGGEAHGQPLEKDFLLIKKTVGGEIITLCADGIALHRAARLYFFKYQYDFKSKLGAHINRTRGKNPWNNQVLDSILRLSIHTLGAEKGVGGTIILLHQEDDIGDRGILNTRNTIKLPPDLKVDVRAHQNLLVTLMKRTDGAVLIDPDGRVKTARNWLVTPSDAMPAAESEGGTRHLTAKMFSHLIKGLVFVISSDGPVTLYDRGEKIFRTCEGR